MKTIILAGGLGTRLRPLTLTVPKPLISVQGKTLTEHVIDIFRKANVENFILSIGYFSEKIIDYFGDGSRWGIHIEYAIEPEPLGTAGPLIILAQKEKIINETFFMVNGDNLFNIDLSKLLEVHKKNHATATIGLTAVPDVSAFGIAKTEPARANGVKITQFIEKPKAADAPSNLINSGYYVLEPEIFELVKKGLSCSFAFFDTFADMRSSGVSRNGAYTNKTIREANTLMMERDIFPVLAEQGKLFGYHDKGLWFDTGTPERYEKVEKEWKGV